MLEPGDPFEPGENFRFIASTKKLFPPITKTETFVQFVCSAAKLGLLFITDASRIKVFQTQEIIDKNNLTPLTEFEIAGGTITHISVNCDGLILLVVAIVDNIPTGFLFDTQTISAAIPFYTAPLSIKPASRVSSLAWNPTDPNCIAVATSTGDLACLNLKETSVQLASQTGIKACVVNWSAKGKQLAVGKLDGSIALYKTDLTLVRTISAPLFEGIGAVVSITWFTNTEFFVGYSLNSGIPTLCYVSAPKGSQPTFSNFEDICYSSDDTRPIFYYQQFISEWNALLVLSSHGIEMGVIGKNLAPDAKFAWTQWFPDEDARAMMQFVNVVHETYPLGFAIDFTSQSIFPSKDDKVKGPFPLLAILSTGGELNVFHVENNYPEAAKLVIEPQSLTSDKIRRPENFGQPPTSPYFRFPQAVPQIQKPPVAEAPISSAPQIVETPVNPRVATSPMAPAIPPPSVANTSFSNPSLQNETVFAGHPGFAFSTPIKPSSPQPVIQAPISIPATIPSISQTSSLAAMNQSISKLAATSVSTPVISTTPTATPATPKTTLASTPKPAATNLSNKALKAILKIEIEQFEEEIKHHCSTSKKEIFQIGAKEEVESIIHNLKSIEALMKDFKSTTDEQNNEIFQLHQGIMDAFSIYEDSKSHSSIKKNPRNIALLQLRPLDPYSKKKLEDIRKKYTYLVSQIEDANSKLDLEWEEYCEQKKQKRRVPSITGESLYHSILNLHHARLSQEKNIETLQQRIKMLTFNDLLTYNHIKSENIEGNVVGHSSSFKETPSKSDSPALSTQKMQNLQRILSQRNSTPVRYCSSSKFQFSSTNDSFDASATLFPDIEYAPKYEDISEPSSPDKTEDTITPNHLAALKSFVGSVDVPAPPPEVSPYIPPAEKSANDKIVFPPPMPPSSSISMPISSAPTAALTSILSSGSALNFKPVEATINNAVSSTSMPFVAKPILATPSHAPASFDDLKPEEKLDSLFKVVSTAPQDPLFSSISAPSFGSKSLFTLPSFASSSAKTSESPISISVLPTTKESAPNSQAISTPATAVVTTTANSISSAFSFPVATKSIFSSGVITSPATTQSLFGNASVSTSAQSLFTPASTSTSAQSLFTPASTSAQSLFTPASTSTSAQSLFTPASTSTSAQSLFTPASISTSAQSLFAPASTSTSAQSLFTPASTAATSVTSTSSTSVASGSTFLLKSPSTSSLTISAVSSASSIFSTLPPSSQSSVSFFNASKGSVGSLPQSSSNGSTISSSLSNLGSAVEIKSEPSAAPSKASIFSGMCEPKAEQGATCEAPVQKISDERSLPLSPSTTSNIDSFSIPSSTDAASATSSEGKLAALLNTSTCTVYGIPSTSESNTKSPFGTLGVDQSTSTPSSIFGSLGSKSTADSLFKPPQISTGTASNSVFGNSSTSSLTPGLFSSGTSQIPSTVPSTTATSSIFAASNAITSGGGAMFGNSSSVTTSSSSGIFGAAQGSVFGNTSVTPFGSSPTTSTTTASASGGTIAKALFGNTNSSNSSSGSVFGAQPASNSVSIFSTTKSSASIFGGAPNIGSGQGIFGGSTAAASSGKSAFGEAASGTSGGVFGSVTTAPAASTGSVFGNAASMENTGNSGGIFGNNQASDPSASSAFSQASPFAKPATSFLSSGGGMFSGLGGAPSQENASKNVFGTLSAVSQPQQTSIFGSQSSAPFGAQKQDATSTPSPFTGGGGGSFSPVNSTSAFGAPATFGGSPSFGSAKYGASPAFGGGAQFGALGSGDTSGTSAGGGGGFANFSSLPGGASFGSLAGQQTQQSPSVFGGQSESTSTFGGMGQNDSNTGFQSTGYSGSSFSSWR